MEDVKVREMQIFDYKKKIAEAETKLKQQQNLYEAVRSDRNLYSKNLIESQVGNQAVADRRLRPRCCHVIRLREVVPCVSCLRWVFLHAVYNQAQGCV